MALPSLTGRSGEQLVPPPKCCPMEKTPPVWIDFEAHPDVVFARQVQDIWLRVRDHLNDAQENIINSVKGEAEGSNVFEDALALGFLGGFQGKPKKPFFVFFWGGVKVYCFGFRGFFFLSCGH